MAPLFREIAFGQKECGDVKIYDNDLNLYLLLASVCTEAYCCHV